jgi:hypothetical protein
VRKAKPGTFEGVNITLGSRNLLRRRRNHLLRLLPGIQAPCPEKPEPLGFTLSKLNHENLWLLVFAAGELCDCLEQGGSVDKWYKSLELRPIHERKIPLNGNRPGPLAIHVKEKRFALSSRRLLGAKKRKPRPARPPA